MVRYFCTLWIMLSHLSSDAQITTEILSKKPFSIGEIIEINSSILQEKRTLNIYLPHGYSTDSAKRYPVIYLLDGSVDEDFIHVSGLVQFASFPWIHTLPESIVVGISNVDRRRDFTFHTQVEKDLINNPTSGKSENFIQFIKTELQPTIEKLYLTTYDKTLIGQSLGGLLATEILFKHPDLFDKYLIISPSLWWDSESLLQLAPQKFSSSTSVYIAVGKEGEMMERPAQELYKKLRQLTEEDNQLYFNFFENQNHGDILHLAIYDAFEKMKAH